MAVIAMTREMATRGGAVAAGLAQRLGLSVVHNEVVEHDVARLAGLQESAVHRFLEGECSLMERWRIDERRMSRLTAHEILELAVKGDVLIRGWGASYLLRSVPHVVCVRICAPMEFRERVLMERINLASAAAARREIERSDAAHGAVMQRMFGADWRAPTLYAIVLNTARVTVEECVDHIARLTESSAFAETAQSHLDLLDALVAARVRHQLQERFGSLGGVVGIETSVAGGRVTLMGASSDPDIIQKVVRSVHEVEGVKGVECRIEHIAFVPHG